MSGARHWGSDDVAHTLTTSGVGLVTYMPGSTLRGLLETLALRERWEPLRVVQCLHESSAVSIAHGYTKASGRPAAVLLHSSVGLLNAALAIFNAALDYAPLLLLVATAPRRSEHKRPWIDRIHAGEEFAGAAADLVKHVAVPGPLEDAVVAVREGAHISTDRPRGPVAVFIDRDVLEGPCLRHRPSEPEFASAATRPDDDTVAALAKSLGTASHPTLLAGHIGLDAWDERVRLVETTRLTVLTDLRLPGAFPTRHPQYGGGIDLQGRPFGDAALHLRDADVVLALEWADPRGASRIGDWESRPPEELWDARLDHLLRAPAAARAERFPTEHRLITASGQETVSSLLAALGGDASRRPTTRWRRSGADSSPPTADLSLSVAAELIRDAVDGQPTTLVKVPVEWRGEWWEIEDEHDYLGFDGGGGLGSGPGLLVGAALGTGERLAIAILGDGDLLMGAHALWTASVAGIAALLVVIDNQGFGTEASHFKQIEQVRRRPAEWELQAFPFRSHPVNVGGIAHDLGVVSFGPACNQDSARECIRSALNAVRSGSSAVVHLRIPST